MSPHVELPRRQAWAIEGMSSSGMSSEGNNLNRLREWRLSQRPPTWFMHIPGRLREEH